MTTSNLEGALSASSMSHRTDNPLIEPQHEWLDLRALTRYAAVSERTLRAWIHAPVDPLPAVQVGKKLLIRRREFDEWLERHRFRPPSVLDVSAMVDEIVAGVSGRK
jgi:excisionase family DNA binding protein